MPHDGPDTKTPRCTHPPRSPFAPAGALASVPLRWNNRSMVRRVLPSIFSLALPIALPLTSTACFEATDIDDDDDDDETEATTAETTADSGDGDGDGDGDTGDGDGDGDGDGLDGSLPIPELRTGGSYSMTAQRGTTELIAGVDTETWGYDGSMLGPTFELRKGQTVSFDVINDLGVPTSVHWHGMHIPSRWDGGPQTAFADGETWSPTWEVRNAAATLWYHPHPMGQTQAQVSMGLAGFILVRDDLEDALALPRTYGVDDLPLVIQDRTMVAGAAIDPMGTLGNLLTVNGAPTPDRDVPAQHVRLRVLNGSVERGYVLGFADDRNFTVIGSDDGLLAAPLTMNRYTLAPGERVEIVVDFADDLGYPVVLRSYGTELGAGIAGGPLGMQLGTPLDNADFDLVTFNVEEATADAITAVPSTLMPSNAMPWQEGDATVTRDMIFTQLSEDPPRFAINGKTMDMARIDETITVDAIEIWNLVNQTGTAHPFHIHDVFFHILDRNGNAPPLWENGPKDTVLVGPGETVRVLTQFRDYVSDPGFPYMYHCHMLSHEDEGMMGQFVTVN